MSSPSIARTRTQPGFLRNSNFTNHSNGPGRGNSAFAAGATQNGHSLPAKEFSIKGAAGPYVVVGSNFAPGTTAADIQSAMESITGEMLGCNVLTPYPTVIAEMVFADKACADTVIATFNNQKVLSRLHYVQRRRLISVG